MALVEKSWYFKKCFDLDVTAVELRNADTEWRRTTVENTAHRNKLSTDKDM